MPYKKLLDEKKMNMLKSMHLAPYIWLSIPLMNIERHFGGNMFRHQMETFTILLNYGYVDAVLLKASVIHDLLEDIPDTQRDIIVSVDEDGPDVLKLVLEVTKREIETKAEFLKRILEFGSEQAQVLKCADRISNITALGYVTDVQKVKNYIKETETYIYPIAERVNKFMLKELQDLVETRKKLYA